MTRADIQRRQEQEDEIEALISAEAQRQVQRRGAAAQAVRGAADEAQDLLAFMRVTGQFGQGPGATTGAAEEELFTRVKTSLGLQDDEEVAKVIEFYRQNPQLVDVGGE